MANDDGTNEDCSDDTPRHGDPRWPHGWYVGEVVARWHADGRAMTLVQDFAYEAPWGDRWDAPARSVIDGASIPRLMWSIIGGPFEGMYRDASVIHDVACAAKERNWREVHEAFYYAMLASGVGEVQAKVMYAAVFHFGPRWPETSKPATYLARNVAMPPVLGDDDFQRLRRVIESRGAGSEGMSLREIQVFQPEGKGRG
jgi:hypothetical protein